MGEKDITEKMLEDYNDVFSDIVNGLLFNGKEVISPDSLVDTGSRSQYKADDRKVHELERDVIKYWKNHESRIALIGLENQTNSDCVMPARVLGYDGASYKNQIASKERKLLPAITLVLYYGKDHWKSPKNLKEILDIPGEIEPFINDYKIHVFEISWLSDEQIRNFKSDFRIVANFFVNRRKDPDYILRDKTEIKHLDSILKLFSALTGDSKYENILTDPDIGEVKTMCEVADRIWNKGVAEGETIMVYKLVQNGKLSVENASDELKLNSSDFIQKMLEAGYKLPES